MAHFRNNGISEFHANLAIDTIAKQAEKTGATPLEDRMFAIQLATWLNGLAFD